MTQNTPDIAAALAKLATAVAECVEKITKLDRQPNPPAFTLKDLARFIYPTNYPIYVDNFSLTIERDPSAGNGGGGELAVFNWDYANPGRTMRTHGGRIVFAKADIERVIEIGPDKYWSDYFAALPPKVLGMVNWGW